MPNHFFLSGVKHVGVFEGFRIREFLIPPHCVIYIKGGVLVQNDQDPQLQEEIGAKALCVVDEEEKANGMKSNREALQMAEMLLEYARFKGNEKLSLVLSKSPDLHPEIVIRNQKQYSIYDCFKK